MSDDHSTHDHLLERIDRAFELDLDPIPGHLTAAAIDAFAWRSADARLAELLYDSASADLVGIRGTSTDRRSFRYGADDFVIRVHLTAATLIVMVEPPLSVECRIASDDGTVADYRTDELGELVIDAPDHPFRIETDLPSGKFVTPFITG